MGNRIWIPEVRMYMDDDTGDFTAGPPPADYGRPGETIPNGDPRQFITGPDGNAWQLAAQTVGGGVQNDPGVIQREGLQPGQYTTQNGLTYISPTVAQTLGQKYGGEGSGIKGFLNGPGPVMGLITAGLGYGAFGPQGFAGDLGSMFGGDMTTFGNAPGIGNGSFMNVGADAAESGGLADFFGQLQQQGVIGSGGGLEQLFSGLDAAGTAGLTGIGANLAQGAASGGASALSRLFSGDASAADYASLLGTLGATGLGVLGSNRQADAYKDVANQYLNIGAPYRDKLAGSYAPDFNLAAQPGYGDAFAKQADVAARSYGAKYGNPADSPTAQAGILGDVWNQSYLPALSNYRGQLGQFGGLGLNTSSTASLAGAGGSDDLYKNLAGGLGALTNPQPNLQDLLKQLQQGGIMGNQQRLNSMYGGV